MFLSEGYVSNKEEIGADPIYAMQIMQEATDDWNDICMKMIKLEHTAIMREDAELLAEGAKETITRLKNNIIVAGRKFIEYLERVRVQWSKLQASIASKFVNQAAISNMQKAMGNAKYNGIKINLPKDYSSMLTVVTEMSTAIKSITTVTIEEVAKTKTNFNSALDAEKSTKSLTTGEETLAQKTTRILEKYKFQEVESAEAPADLTWELVGKALKFLKERPVAIKNIEVMKKAVTQVQNAKIKDLDTEKENRAGMKNELVVLQSAFNKLIIKINKQTSTAVKICRTALNSKDSGITASQKADAFRQAKNTKGLTFKEKAQAGASTSTAGASTSTTAVNESVLDLFG